MADQYSRASLVAQLVKNPPAMRETWLRSLGWEDSPGEGKGYPLRYSGLEDSMDSKVHRVAKSQTRLSTFHFQYSSYIYTISFIHSLVNAHWVVSLSDYE